MCKKRETCFSALAAEPLLLAVPLPHVDVPAAGLGERLPADPTVMRLLAWETQTRRLFIYIYILYISFREVRGNICAAATSMTSAQTSHSPECTSMCFRRLEYSAKDRPQPSASHRNGFSPGRTHTHTLWNPRCTKT